MTTLMLKSILWGLLSTFVSVAISWISIYFLGLPETNMQMLVGSAAIPMLIAIPVCYQLGNQINKIAESRQKISELHLSLVNAHEELRDRARRDHLTGILNRSGFFEAATSLPSNVTNAIVMLDIDHFKKINDTYGHEVGDRAICETVNCINRVVRKSDIFGRVGGEEFAIALPDTSLVDAEALCERIRKAIAAIRFIPVPEVMHLITVSIGVEEFSNANGLNDALKKADEALYQSKRKGRNRVSVFQKLKNAA